MDIPYDNGTALLTMSTMLNRKLQELHISCMCMDTLTHTCKVREKKKENPKSLSSNKAISICRPGDSEFSLRLNNKQRIGN